MMAQTKTLRCMKNQGTQMGVTHCRQQLKDGEEGEEDQDETETDDEDETETEDEDQDQDKAEGENTMAVGEHDSEAPVNMYNDQGLDSEDDEEGEEELDDNDILDKEGFAEL